MKIYVSISVMFLAVSLSAETWTDSNGLEWAYSITNGEAVVGVLGGTKTAVSPLVSGELIVPAELGGCPVTRIGEGAFRDCNELVSVKIPTTVVGIECLAFAGCTSLTNIIFSENLTTIYNGAFARCVSLTSIVLPPHLKSLGEWVPSRTWSDPVVSLINLTVDGGITYQPATTVMRTISHLDGEGVFDGCRSLKSISLPVGLLKIGPRAFRKCVQLPGLRIPSSVRAIGAGAFSDCVRLLSIDLPVGLEILGYAVGEHSPGGIDYDEDIGGMRGVPYFKDVRDEKMMTEDGKTYPLALTTSISFSTAWCENPDFCDWKLDWTDEDTEDKQRMYGATNTVDGVFYHCVSLKEIVIPKGLRRISHYAFCGCESLMRVVFQGDCPRLVGNGIYRGCPQCLQSIVPMLACDWIDPIEGKLPMTWKERSISYDYAYGTTVVLTMPASVTNGCTNVVCVGWVGTGDVPAVGTSNAVSFVVTQASTLRWLYETNYWVSATADAGGRVTLKDAADVALPVNELWAVAGTNLVAEATADEGHAFARWVDEETGAELGHAGRMTLPVDHPWLVWAEFTNLVYEVRFELGEHGSHVGGGALAQTVAWGDAAVAPTVEVEDGYTFSGWSEAFDRVTQDLVVTAQYDEVDVTRTLVSETETYVDAARGEVAPCEKAAAVYDGYLYEGDGVVKGTIQVKVAKGKVGKKTGVFSAKVTATVQLADGSRKISFKNGVADAAGNVTEMADKTGNMLAVSLGVNGFCGTFRRAGDSAPYQVDGALNLFSAKDKAAKEAVKTIEDAWVGAINVVGDGVVLSVTIAKKGKVKVSGRVNGAKVSATSRLLVGAEVCCVPVVITKKAKLAFNLWLAGDGSVEVAGLDGMTAVKAGTLKSGAAFRMDGAALAQVLPGLLTDYLPGGLAVGLNKKKWIVAPDEKGKSAKAGKVAFDKKRGEIDETKLGANPAALKLTYTAKSGSFKGSFKAYTLVNGKVKSYTVNVTGVMVGDRGYGMATVMKPAVSWPVTIE